MKFWGKSHLSFNVLPKAFKGIVVHPGQREYNISRKYNRTVIQEKHRTNVTTEKISESVAVSPVFGVT